MKPLEIGDLKDYTSAKTSILPPRIEEFLYGNQ